VYGDDTANWAGKPIEIYPTQTEFRGDMVDAIRIRVPDVDPRSTPAPTAAAPMGDDNLDDELNDDISDLPWA
jgi:hypothetical protein